MDKFLEILNPSKLSQEKSESLSRPTTASEIEAVIKKLPAYKVKNNIGNVEAKELICITHGHERKGGNGGGSGCVGQRGIKGEKWDNCNSIINKIYFYKKHTKDLGQTVSKVNFTKHFEKS